MKMWKLSLKIFLTLFLLCQTQAAAEFQYLEGFQGRFLRDQKYGEFDRNSFDIFLPESTKPTPLVIFFHGGGFTSGDKSKGWRRTEDAKAFIKSGIAFASVNYRYRKSNDQLGVNACLQDAIRFVQFIRFHASKYNIDKQRLGAYGSSAGAGISLYLAYSDNHADSSKEGPQAESTRLNCVGALSTQATYDLYRWLDFVPFLKIVFYLQKSNFESEISHFYGFGDNENFDSLKDEILDDLDMLAMIDPSDPPTYVMNLQKTFLPKNFDSIEHHTAHARELEKELNQNKIKNIVFVYSKKTPTERDLPIKVHQFLISQLRKE